MSDELDAGESEAIARAGERLQEATDAAQAILRAAGSDLKHYEEHSRNKIVAAALEALGRNSVAERKRAEEYWERLLSDPNVVHANMLRGTVAKPSISQLQHLYAGQLSELAAAVLGDPRQAVTLGS